MYIYIYVYIYIYTFFIHNIYINIFPIGYSLLSIPYSLLATPYRPFPIAFAHIALTGLCGVWHFPLTSPSSRSRASTPRSSHQSCAILWVVAASDNSKI